MSDLHIGMWRVLPADGKASSRYRMTATKGRDDDPWQGKYINIFLNYPLLPTSYKLL